MADITNTIPIEIPPGYRLQSVETANGEVKYKWLAPDKVEAYLPYGELINACHGAWSDYEAWQRSQNVRCHEPGPDSQD